MDKFIYKILGCIDSVTEKIGNVFTPTPKRDRSKGKYRADNKSTKKKWWTGSYYF